MKEFCDAIDDCQLSDCGYLGDKFTWHSGNIRERLDRALANDAWNNLFKNTVVQHLNYYKSDHRPILMSIEEEQVQERSGPSLLRFEARWLKEKDFAEIVQSAWEHSGLTVQSGSLAARLAIVHENLHKWDKAVLKRTKNKLRGTRRELEKVAAQALTSENIVRQKELSEEVEKLLEMEEIHWAIRSRVDWLQFGDRNTDYFHNAASARRKRNRIKRLKDGQGNWQDGSAYLNPLIFDYFVGLFSIEIAEPDPNFFEKVTPKVSGNMNAELLKPYSA